MDDYFVICEKPVGVSSESPGLPELIREQSGFPVYPVHRLDRTTGGICILARSPDACARLQKLFQTHRIEKRYYAVIAGKPQTETGVFDDYLYHDKKKNKTYVVKRMRKGVRDARCEWELLDSVMTADISLSLISIRLDTGRTHQIRVQFSSRGYPLAGDQKYGSRVKAPSPALWATRISFPHPYIKDKMIDVSSMPPAVYPWNCFEKLNL